MARDYGAPERLPQTEKVTGPQRKDPDRDVKSPDPSPSAEIVRQFHKNSDVDVRPESIHHTLGAGKNQATAGDHNHNGGNSKLLLEGYTITGSRSAGTTITSIIAALVRLGAKDESTA